MSAIINASVPIASPLAFAERLIALAIDADRSGFSAAARRLAATAHAVLDRPSTQPLSPPAQGDGRHRDETGEAPVGAVGLPTQTATIHALRFGADGQRGVRGRDLAHCERFAITRLAAR
jgi:hypothetical protein